MRWGYGGDYNLSIVVVSHHTISPFMDGMTFMEANHNDLFGNLDRV